MFINENKKSSEEVILFEPMIFDMPEKNSTVYHDAMEFYDSPGSVPLEVLENMSASDFEIFMKIKKHADEYRVKYLTHETEDTDFQNLHQEQKQLPEEHEAMKTCFQHNKLEQTLPQVETLPAQRVVSLPNNENQNNFSVKNVNDNNAQKSELNAYHATQELIRSEIIAVVNYKPYLYKNFYYKRLNSDEIQTEILEKCRKYISKTGRAHFLSDVERFIIHEPMLQRPEKKRENLIIFDNLILNIDNGECYEHNPNYFSLHRILASYNPDLNYCPNFNKLLIRISGGDPLIILRIWEMIGYILSPDVTAKVFFVLQGVHDSGKSLLSEILKLFFDDEDCTSLSIHELSGKFDKADLIEKKLCLSPDLSADSLTPSVISTLKQLTGNDFISTDVKNKNRAKFYFKGKYLCATNFALNFGRDAAFLRRIIVIPFQYQIQPHEMDPNIIYKIMKEKDSIASVAMQHYFKLRNNNYNFSGNFRINDPRYIDCTYNAHIHDLDEDITFFLKNYFRIDDKTLTYTRDAYKLFVNKFYCVSETAFGKKFKEIAFSLYGLESTRKHPTPTENARQCIPGLEFISPEELNGLN